jgi:hypothetical protein
VERSETHQIDYGRGKQNRFWIDCNNLKGIALEFKKPKENR